MKSGLGFPLTDPAFCGRADIGKGGAYVGGESLIEVAEKPLFFFPVRTRIFRGSGEEKRKEVKEDFFLTVMSPCPCVLSYCACIIAWAARNVTETKALFAVKKRLISVKNE